MSSRRRLPPLHNGMVDKKPALVARCRGVADVVDAINIARDYGLEVAVRGGDTTWRAERRWRVV
jgi:FAD/FMN-containing dehydrogenase